MVARLGALCLLVVVGVALVMPAASPGASRLVRGPGFSLRVPADLYVSNRPLSTVTDPVQRFVLSNYYVPSGRPDVDGTYSPPARGVIAELLEQVPSDNPAFEAPPRPAAFGLPRLNEPSELFGPRWGGIPFRDRGRDFSLLIGVGSRATPAAIREVLATLDGLEIGPPPPGVSPA